MARKLNLNEQYLKTLQMSHVTLYDIGNVLKDIELVKNLRKKAVICQGLSNQPKLQNGEYIAAEDKQEYERDKYFEALKLLLNYQTCRASFETTKILLVKTLG